MVPGLRKPQVNDPVMWYPDGNRELPPTPGIIIAAGQDASDILLHTVGGGHQVRPSVFHCADERLAENEFIRKTYGGWDYAPWLLEMLDLRKQCEKIVYSLGEKLEIKRRAKAGRSEHMKKINAKRKERKSMVLQETVST